MSLHGKGVDQEEFAGQRFTHPCKYLDHLHRLHGTDYPRQGAEHPDLRAIGHVLGIGAFGEQATVGGPFIEVEHADLTLELENGPMDKRFASHHAGIVDEVASGEIVGTVDHHVDALQEVEGVVDRETLHLGNNFDVRVEVTQAIDCGLRRFANTPSYAQPGG